MTDGERQFSPEALEWIRSVSDLTGSLRIDLCPGGRSNLTYRIQDVTGRSAILRRPPSGTVLPTAHDMGREFRFLSALSPTGFPVPRPLAICYDSTLIGTPFYLMEEAKGLILRDRDQATTLATTTRALIGPNLVATLAELHSLDPNAINLQAKTDPRSYLARQLDRWLGQVSRVRSFKAELTDTVTAVGQQLRAEMPVTDTIGIVHGDYRLDNVVLTNEGTVVAVLDWEIASIGDPLADIGMLGVYWADAGDDQMDGVNGATKIEGFTARLELYKLYAELRQIDPERIYYYERFGSWKLACILIGVVERYRNGASGGDQSSVENYPLLIAALLESATRSP